MPIDPYSALLAIAIALGLGAISPGPSFIVVARNAATLSRQHGMATALGMGTGALLFALMAMLGLAAVLHTVPIAYAALKVGGGAYLVYLGYLIIRGAAAPFDVSTTGTTLATAQRPLWQSYLHGLFTQLSNPKTAIVFASVFSASLPTEFPPSFYLFLPLIAFILDGGWYLCVAYVLSAEQPRQRFLSHKTMIDRAAGTVLGLLGLKLMSDVALEFWQVMIG
jgi:threonine/homoserine/homoserine lactone efflux protein